MAICRGFKNRIIGIMLSLCLSCLPWFFCLWPFCIHVLLCLHLFLSSASCALLEALLPKDLVRVDYQVTMTERLSFAASSFKRQIPLCMGSYHLDTSSRSIQQQSSCVDVFISLGSHDAYLTKPYMAKRMQLGDYLWLFIICPPPDND